MGAIWWWKWLGMDYIEHVNNEAICLCLDSQFLNNHLLSFCFTLKNINCCFTDTNQQHLTYGKKYSIEMLCCNVGKCKSFSRFLSMWNKTEFWLCCDWLFGISLTFEFALEWLYGKGGRHWCSHRNTGGESRLMVEWSQVGASVNELKKSPVWS